MSGTEKRATTAPKPGKPGSHTKAPRDVSEGAAVSMPKTCLLYTSPSPRDRG